MKALPYILVFGLAGWFLPACSTAFDRAPTAPAAENQNDTPARRAPLPPGNPEAFAHFAAGESYLNNDDAVGSLQQWEDAALADPGNEKLVLEVAAQLMQNKATDKALAVLAKSGLRADASATILAWLARSQLECNHTNEALATSKRAIRRQPAALDGYECQVEVLLHDQQWAEAAHTIHRAAEHVPSGSALLLAVADLYNIYLKVQPKDAKARARDIALLDRIATLKLDSARFWQRLAEDYAGVNQQKKAAEIYTRLLAEYPEPSFTRDSILEKLAGIYIQSDDRTNAVKQLQALIRDNPTHYPRAWFVLGELAYEGGKLQEAADDFGNALHGDPTIEQAYYDLALVQLDLHHSREAFETLEQARDRFPKTFDYEFYSGVIQAHVKNYSEAIRHFKEAEVIGLASDPARLDQRFYFQLGAACERNASYEQADQYLQKCIGFAPNFAEALNYLGYMLADRGEQLPRARALIEKAVSLDPKNGAYLDSLGWVLFKLKLPQQALPHLLKALQYSPEADPTVLDHLGEVYLALHQSAKAVEVWKKSFSIDANEEARHKLEQFSGGSL